MFIWENSGNGNKCLAVLQLAGVGNWERDWNLCEWEGMGKLRRAIPAHLWTWRLCSNVNVCFHVLCLALTSRGGSIYRKYRDISPISILSDSYRIDAFDTGFFRYGYIVSMTNKMSVISRHFLYSFSWLFLTLIWRQSTMWIKLSISMECGRYISTNLKLTSLTTLLAIAKYEIYE